jgi:hypothetical protein
MKKKLLFAIAASAFSLALLTAPAVFAEECTETNDCACNNGIPAVPDSMNCDCPDSMDCACEDTMNCACEDPMNCGEFGNESCGITYSCSCNPGNTCSCNPESVCACNDGSDEVPDTMDCPCCEEGPGCGESGEICVLPHTCMTRNVCSGGGNRNTPGGTCSGTEETCAVAIVHSCNDDNDCDTCDQCDENGGCYNPGPWCGNGGVTECSYSFSGSSTGCDGVTRTASASFTTQVTDPNPCPSSDMFAAAAQASIADQLASMHPAECCAGGIPKGPDGCDPCLEGQILMPDETCCDPEVEECDVCSPIGQIPRPGGGCCDPETEDCDWCPAGQVLNPDGSCCDPEVEECEGIDLCPNIAGQQSTLPNGMTINAYGQCVCGAGSKICADTCIPNEECCASTEVCCPPGQEACPDCRPAEECVDACVGYAVAGEYCTEIATDAGTTNQPWATKYPSETALNAFFARRSIVGAESFSEALDSQEAARTDGDPVTVASPIMGRITTLVGGGSCNAQVCNHGQECALYVRAGGGTSATCVDTVCDPCDPTGGCYDLALCECDPDLSVECCEYAPDKGSSLSCVLPRRGLAIEVLPNLIDRGDSCFVFWAAQGMESVTVTGESFDSGANYDLRNLMAGAAEVANVQTSSVYKIVGVGSDGKTYEATDLCATNPVINEL